LRKPSRKLLILHDQQLVSSMKKPALLLFAAGTLLLASCADKTTDRHSSMSGGNQGGPPPGVTDAKNNGTPANTDGMARPMAGGKVNTVADTMWNQSAPAAQKPF
jgi:hypothetical protein